MSLDHISCYSVTSLCCQSDGMEFVLGSVLSELAFDVSYEQDPGKYFKAHFTRTMPTGHIPGVHEKALTSLSNAVWLMKCEN